jgi:predicted Zn-dependent peptidase
LAIPLPATHRAVVSAHLRVGSRFEDRKTNGLSHFLEHMLYRGTAEHPSAHDLAVAFERIGGSLVATTSSDTGTLEVTAPPPSLTDTISLFSEVLSAPTFTGIDTERGIVREEILESLDDDGQCISSDDLIRELLFDGHPLGQPISGTLSQLGTFDLASLRAHHGRFYCGANTTVAVTGPIDAEAALDALEGRLGRLPNGGLPSSSAPSGLDGPRIRRVAHRSSQTEITIGFRAPGFTSADEPRLDLLSRILDDGMATRLYHQLCDERGLCYDVSGTYESYSDSGLLELVAETSHDRVAEVVELLLAIVTDLKLHGPSEAELETAKRRHRWQLDAMLDSPNQVADWYLTEELMGTQRDPVSRSEELLAVSAADVRDAAQHWLTNRNLASVLVGFPKRGESAKVDRLFARFD